MTVLRAPAKLNLCLYLGATARRRAARAALALLPAAAGRPDRGRRGGGRGATRSSAPGSTGPNLVGVALEAMRARGWRAPAAAGGDREADPGRRRARRRQRRRGRGPAARRRARWAICRARGRARRRRALAARPRVRAGRRAPARWSSRCRRPGEFAVVLIPRRRRAVDGRRLRARPTRSGSGAARRSSTGSAGGCARPRAAGRRRSTTRSCSSTTSSRRRSRCARGSPRRWRRSTRSARRGRWSTGSGPTAVGLFEDLRRRRRGGGGAAAPIRERDRLGAAAAPIIGPLKLEGEKRSRWRLVVIAAIVVAGFVAFKLLRARHRRRAAARGPLARPRRLDLRARRRARLPRDGRLRRASSSPGETAVILGGAVAGQGETSIVITIAIVWFCAWAGDTTSFCIGTAARARLRAPPRAQGADHATSASSRSRATSRATAARRS